MDERRFNHAISLRDAGRVEAAYREFIALSESTPDPEEKASLLANQARCSLLLGDLESARGALHSAVEIAPKTETLLYIWFEEALLRWHEGRREEALSILDQVRREQKQVLLEPTHRELHGRIEATRSILLTELSRFREARQCLEESLRLDLSAGDKADVLYNLGVCSIKAGEPERAERLFLQALNTGLSPVYTPLAHYNLGVAYSRQGAPAKALREFEWCLDHTDGPNIPKQNLYGWLAKVSDDLGMKAEADRYERLANEASADTG